MTRQDSKKVERYQRTPLLTTLFFSIKCQAMERNLSIMTKHFSTSFQLIVIVLLITVGLMPP